MMMHGLLSKDISRELQQNEKRNDFLVLDNIAFFYKEWLCSPPFDIGKTTRTALMASLQDDDPKWTVIRDKAIKCNQ